MKFSAGNANSGKISEMGNQNFCCHVCTVYIKHAQFSRKKYKPEGEGWVGRGGCTEQYDARALLSGPRLANISSFEKFPMLKAKPIQISQCVGLNFSLTLGF